MVSKFRKFFPVADKVAIQWFPGHMGSGMRMMQQKLKMVDCVIEVHDSRIPFSGRNTDFKHTVSGLRPHILVLNKKDLSDPSTHHETADLIKKTEGIDHVVFTNCRDQTCDGVRSIVPIARKLIVNSNRFNRNEQPDFNIMIIGVPNVGKSSLTNALRNRHLKAKKATAVGAIAGITRSVLTRIKISQRPLIYMYDTPGILTPRVADTDQGMKLAAVSCLPDHLVGFISIADYIIYWLNKNEIFSYVDYMGLKEPTDDIQEVLRGGAALLNKEIKVRLPDGQLGIRPDFDFISRHLIKGFRSGELGKFNLDADILAKNRD